MTAPLTLFSLPLFPLHTVLFPKGSLPLRVFEPRYRTMVRCCREQGTPFGVVTLLAEEEVRTPQSAPEVFHTVGTTAVIESSSALSSGLELLQCSGCDRFRILHIRRLDSELWVADVQLMAPDAFVPVPKDLLPTAKALRQVMSKVLQRQTYPVEDSNFNDCGWVANRWCELLPMKHPAQLQLLALDSPLLRLELVTDALEDAGILS